MDPDDKPDAPPDPPTPPADPPRHEHCDSMISALNDRVEALENLVRTIIDLKPDTSPVRKPWTHRRFGGGR